MLLEDLIAAVEHGSESDSVEYKGSIDLNSPGDWLEIVKDIVALANSGGGVIVFGIDDDGKASGWDCTPLQQLDSAVLTDKIYKYTGLQFHNFDRLAFSRGADRLFAMPVGSVHVPLVFSKPGTYDVGGGKQKTAFSGGTVYFRHGAKSEPANSEDLRIFIERRVEKIRKSWMDGIAKVVKAPEGSKIQVVIPTLAVQPEQAVRLVDDPNAPTFKAFSVDDTHPYRQKEVVAELNRALNGKKTIKPFHIQCVRQAHNTDANPNFCYKQKFASARYSQAFIDWVVQQHAENADFFESAKTKLDELKRSATSGA